MESFVKPLNTFQSNAKPLGMENKHNNISGQNVESDY